MRRSSLQMCIRNCCPWPNVNLAALCFVLCCRRELTVKFRSNFRKCGGSRVVVSIIEICPYGRKEYSECNDVCRIVEQRQCLDISVTQKIFR